MFTQEKIAEFNRAHLEQLSVLSQSLYAGFTQAVELNIESAKEVLTQSQKMAAQALTVKTPEDLQACMTLAAKPAYEHAKAYAESVKSIGLAAVCDVTSFLEAQRQSVTESFAALTSAQASAHQGAFPGADNVIQMVKSFAAQATATPKKSKKTA